jgi:glutamine amidotransferase-like uncharacterized protein
MSVLAAAAAILVGCIGVNPENVTASSGEEPSALRVAVFVGNGARNVGAYRWIEIATTSDNTVATPVDGASIRAGALDSADVLIMPGGSAHVEANELGADGRERVKAFVRGGGGYIGTCAGFYLVTQPFPGRKANYLGLIPFRDTIDGMNGEAELMFNFSGRAEELAGIREGDYKIRYSHGPVPERSDNEVEGTRAEVVATFNCDYNPRGDLRPPKAGRPAAVAAECGKGRVFVFSCHPESDYDDREVIEGAFRYVTRGREVRWSYPRRKAGQLAVGFVSDDSFGSETGRFVQRLIVENEFDIIPTNAKFVKDGALRRFDAVLVPPGTGGAKSRMALDGVNIGLTRKFIARGGLVVAWGNAAERLEKAGLEGFVRAADAEAALARLRKFSREPADADAPFRPPEKVERPVKTAVFAEDGCLMDGVPQLLEFSPEYAVGIVGVKDILAGTLKDYDVLYMPDGDMTAVNRKLGEKGRLAIADFVRRGGKYYGAGGGALLVSQTRIPPDEAQKNPDGTRFAGLVPFSADRPGHRRGTAPVNICFTDGGKRIFNGADGKRTIWYADGPVFAAAGEVEDSDVEIFAKYESRTVSTENPSATPDMSGKAAIVGGRVGKGAVLAQCADIGTHESSFDMVRDSFRYLAGARPTGELPDRRRGAKSVLVKTGCGDGMNEAVRFVLKDLLHDARFDCRIICEMDNNWLSHADVAVMCDFDAKSWTPALRAFAASGGKVVFVADTDAKRRTAEKFDGAVVLDSWEKVMRVIGG